MRMTKKIEAARKNALDELEYAKHVSAGTNSQVHDPEAGATLADGALLAFIRAIGFDDVADAWDAVEPKW